MTRRTYKIVWQFLISSFAMMPLSKVDRRLREIFIFVLCVLICKCHGLNCRSGNNNKEHELQRIYRICRSRQSGEDYNNSRTDEGSNEWFGVPNYRKTANYNYNINQRYDIGRRYDSDLDYDRVNAWNDDRNIDDVRVQRDKMNRNGDVRSFDKTDRFAAPLDDEAVNNRPSYSYTGSRNILGRNPFGYWDGNKMIEKDPNSGVVDFSDRNNRDTDSYDNHGLDMIQTRSMKNNQQKLRVKRERRPERISGSRSQYNPNTSRKSMTYYDDSSNDESGSRNKSVRTTNSSRAADRACVLHCYLDKLGMTAADGLPDKYLVTHVLTKDITSEDLKDFLVESIEECFQIVDNEQTEGQDKCDLSKNLLLCLSEKGRANCDDWKEDANFKIASHRINAMMN